MSIVASSSTLETKVADRIRQYRQKIDRIPALQKSLASGDHDEDTMRGLQLQLEECHAARLEETEFLLDAARFIQRYENEEDLDGDHTITTTTSGVEADDVDPSAAAATAAAVLLPPTMDSFVTVTAKRHRHRVLLEYMSRFDGDVDATRALMITMTPSRRGTYAAEHYTCSTCDVPLLYDAHQSQLICPQCAVAFPHMEMNALNQTFDQEQSSQLITSYSYKRLNHFMDYLNSLQGRDSAEIPKDVIDAVALEFKKNRVATRNAITPAKVREYLKKLSLQRHYEHVHTIASLLNGIPPPQLGVDLEKTFRAMFLEIQKPFERHCPSSRKNFLSYSYCLHKFANLVGRDDLTVHFPLLKSQDKLFACDHIFKKICADLNWEFVPSV
jgi:hypothetical protein